MKTGAEAYELLQSERALRLHGLCVGPDPRELRIWADGTRVDDEWTDANTGLPDLDRVLGKTREIVVRPGCRRYEISFLSFVYYALRVQTFANSEPGDEQTGPLRHYDDTSFLHYGAQSTLADTLLEQPLHHIALATLDQVIDVATPDDPYVTARTLTATELWLPGPELG